MMANISTHDLATAEKLLKDPLWRLNNLYKIVDKSGQQCTFKLNWAQQQLYRDMWFCNIILKARQLGISTFIGLLFLDRCLFNKNCSAGIITHTKSDSEVFFKRIKYAYDNLPDELKAHISAVSDNSQSLCLSNGSSLRVATSMRSGTLQFLHISELGRLSAKYPDKATEVVSGSINAVSAGQYIFVESTAEGRSGVFYELCKQAQAIKDARKPLSKLDFKFHFYPWHHPQSSYRLSSDGIVISDELNKYFDSIEAKCRCKLDLEQRCWYSKRLEVMKESQKSEFPSTAEEAFEAAADGNYYSQYLVKARQEKRITKLFHDPTKPVHSSWDLGFSDSTSIFLFQIDGQRINILEYFENSGESLPFYIRWLKSRPYTLGTHLTPHDSAQHDYGTGLTRTETARSLGIIFDQVKKLSIAEGIDICRNTFSRCYFDEQGCEKGIRLLDDYKKDWNDAQGVWSSKPCHNYASHCADSFRTLCCGLHLLKDDNSPDETVRIMQSYLRGGH